MTQIIAIEGVDGVGKTTLCETLKTHFALFSNKVFVAKTPYLDYKNLTSLAGNESSFGAFCAYLLADISIKNQLNNYDWIILDRYILTTLVYNHALITSLRKNIHNILKHSGLLNPTYTIFLEAEETLLRDRHISRSNYSRHSYNTKELKETFEKYLVDKEFGSYIGKLIKLPSETKSDQDQAVETIITLLK